jgi:signal transduction histidine kinase
VLELVVKRSRALLDARARGHRCSTTASRRHGGRGPSRRARADRADDVPQPPLGSLRVYGGPFNDEDERPAAGVRRERGDRRRDGAERGEEALRRSLEASEAERSRWARELHDETLQQLAGLRMLLAGARRSGDRERIDAALEAALSSSRPASATCAR